MDILAVNLNKYKGIESVVKDDLAGEKINYLLVNGESECFLDFTSELNIPSLYVGFSPLSSSELVGFAALLSFLNHSEHYTVKYYEEPKFSFSTDPLIVSLISYFKSSDLTKTIFYTYNISDNTSGAYEFVPDFGTIIYPYFKFNKLIYSLYTTSLGACQYKDMGRNILSSLNNNSISVTLTKNISAFETNLPEFQSLTKCLDFYLKLAKRKEINALVFYVALFFNISSFNKNRKEFAVSYVFLQRAIETALTYYYLSSGVLEVNEYDRLCFKGERKPIQGVGELIKEYFSKNSYPDLEKKISKLNFIRNCSILAHGFHIPSSNEYNELFEASKNLVEGLFSNNDAINFYKISLDSLKPLSKEHIREKISSFFNKKL